jgi:hypothetical protein
MVKLSLIQNHQLNEFMKLQEFKVLFSNFILKNKERKLEVNEERIK